MAGPVCHKAKSVQNRSQGTGNYQKTTLYLYEELDRRPDEATGDTAGNGRCGQFGGETADNHLWSRPIS